MKVLVEVLNFPSKLYKGNLKYYVSIKNTQDILKLIEQINRNKLNIINE